MCRPVISDGRTGKSPRVLMTAPQARPQEARTLLVVLGRAFGLFAAFLAGRHRHLLRLGRGAWDERDVDFVLVLAGDEDGRVRRQRAAEDEVGERVLDEALDRAPERPRAHGRVVALLDEEVLRVVG